jgi:predicted ABC-type ATPase
MVDRRAYIIAGPNGAGKTTFAREFLPNYAHCPEFLNADLVAAGLSPFDPNAAAVAAGRVLLARMKQLIRQGKDFGFETTLAGKRYLSILRNMKNGGYRLHLFYLWLPNVELAIARVARRVEQGGHNIPEDVLRRRFEKGSHNLIKSYLPMMDSWFLFDNSSLHPRMAARYDGADMEILDAAVHDRALNAPVAEQGDGP